MSANNSNNYLIKKASNYLHQIKTDLVFTEKKKDSMIFNDENANIILRTLEKHGIGPVIKVKVKEKNVYKEPIEGFKPLANYRRKRAKKILSK